MTRIEGIIFDKDGTLFEHSHTWDDWAGNIIDYLAEGNPEWRLALAKELCYNLKNRTYFADSPLIACTNRQAAQYIVRALPHCDVEAIERYLMLSSVEASLAPATDLLRLFSGFQAYGLRLGMVTNDSEYGAYAHLNAAGVTPFFDFIAGYDSGFGAKPDPEPLLVFSSRYNLNPASVLMVGDSRTDLSAGRAAGMQTVGVLTGVATRADLADLADCVLPDIGDLPEWLAMV